MNPVIARSLGGYRYVLRRIRSQDFDGTPPHNQFNLRHVAIHEGNVNSDRLDTAFHSTIEGMADENLYLMHYQEGEAEAEEEFGGVDEMAELIRLEQPDDGVIV